MSFTKRRIFFRADGNSEIGLGHIIRCLSLIEMLKNNFECLFLVSKPEIFIKKLIQKYCILVELKFDLKNEIIELSEIVNKKDILVLDGYHFNSDYQKIIKAKINKLVIIDDQANYYYYADLIINHGISPIKDKYDKDERAKILTGFQYVILRREFLKAAKRNRKVFKVDTAFICMGGADPFNITAKATSACIVCNFIKKIIIVTGSAYKNKSDLAATIDTSNKEIIHEENVNAKRVVELAMMSEIGISTSSSVALEICCIKLGLLTGTVADNQNAIHKGITDSNCGISLGDFIKASVEDIVTHLQKLETCLNVNFLMQSQSKLIDGLSGVRILQEFKKLTA